MITMTWMTLPRQEKTFTLGQGGMVLIMGQVGWGLKSPDPKTTS